MSLSSDFRNDCARFYEGFPNYPDANANHKIRLKSDDGTVLDTTDIFYVERTDNKAESNDVIDLNVPANTIVQTIEVLINDLSFTLSTYTIDKTLEDRTYGEAGGIVRVNVYEVIFP